MTAVTAPPTRKRDTMSPLVSELVPDQVLPKVLSTFGLVAIYVFIIYWITGASLTATFGWNSIPMWAIGIVVFLVPAGLAVSELGNLWPAQGGVYIWAYRTMNEPLAFLGGFMSWIPVILNGASSPVVMISFLMLALHASIGLTASILLQVALLWVSSSLALLRLTAGQRLMKIVVSVYGVITAITLVIGIVHASRHGSATPVHVHDLLVPDFGLNGVVFGIVLLYLVGVETPFNMGAEFLSVRRSATKMILWGSVALSVGYVVGTIGTLLSLPVKDINGVTGVMQALSTAGIPGLMEVCAIGVVIIVIMAMATYQSAYSRLIFVSGLERHLPRIFTHLNPKTRNPVTAILVQSVISTAIIVGLASQASLTNVFLYLTGSLTVIWLFSGFFFFIPVIIARYRYADRYVNETFWRIPGGKPAVWVVGVVGSVGTAIGIYWTFKVPLILDQATGEWIRWVGTICGIALLAAVLIYVFGGRSARKLSSEDALAHLAVFDKPVDTTADTPADTTAHTIRETHR